MGFSHLLTAGLSVALRIDPKFIDPLMTSDAELAAKVSKDLPSITTTITPAGTVGNRTINTAAGTVNFASGAQTLTVTNSLCTANSIVIPVVRTADTNSAIFSCVPAEGSFTITLAGPAETEVSVGFIVFN